MLISMVEIKFKELAAAVKLVNDSGLLEKKIATVSSNKEKIVDDFVAAVISIHDDPETGEWKGPVEVAEYYNKIVMPDSDVAEPVVEKSKPKAKAKAKNKLKAKADKTEGGEVVEKPYKPRLVDERGRPLYKPGTNAGKIQEAIINAGKDGITYDDIALIAKIDSTAVMPMIKKTVGDIIFRGLAARDGKKIVYIS